MAEGIILSGFGGVGKTSLANKYKNVIDLESSLFKYVVGDDAAENFESQKGRKDRKLNKNYPENYIAAIKDACKHYDIVCVRYNGDMKVDFYDTYGLNYIVCCPTKEAYEGYVERFRNRGNPEEWIKKNQKLFKIAYRRCLKFKGEKIFLDKNETLESALLKRGYKLLPKTPASTPTNCNNPFNLSCT